MPCSRRKLQPHATRGRHPQVLHHDLARVQVCSHRTCAWKLQGDAARGGLQQSCQQVHERGLARAAFAKQQPQRVGRQRQRSCIHDGCCRSCRQGVSVSLSCRGRAQTQCRARRLRAAEMRAKRPVCASHDAHHATCIATATVQLLCRRRIRCKPAGPPQHADLAAGSLRGP